MYKLQISAKAKGQLKQISKLYEKIAVIEAIELIKEDPLLGKPLSRELIGKFSFKIGVYRIIYRVNTKDKKVTIIRAGHRSTVYQ